LERYLRVTAVGFNPGVKPRGSRLDRLYSKTAPMASSQAPMLSPLVFGIVMPLVE